MVSNFVCLLSSCPFKCLAVFRCIDIDDKRFCPYARARHALCARIGRSLAPIFSCTNPSKMMEKRGITTRRKFRPPLKVPQQEFEGSSCRCSQTSTSTTGLVGVSQERGKEDSQSWLSQLTTDSGPKETALSSHDLANGLLQCEVADSNNCRASLDDSLCSYSEIDNLKHGDVHDSLSGELLSTANPTPLHQTQTHTVLSYCNEASASSVPAAVPQKKATAAIALDKFQISADLDYIMEFDSTHHNPESLSEAKRHQMAVCVAASTKCTTGEFLVNLLSDSEDEVMPELGEERRAVEKEALGPSRFQRKNKCVTHRYDYGSVLSKAWPQRGTVKKGTRKTNNKARTKKRVSLVPDVHPSKLSGVVSSVVQDNANKGDLSVFDYQPTPQKDESEPARKGEDSLELNNSNWITKRTREEQVSHNSYMTLYMKVQNDIFMYK